MKLPFAVFKKKMKPILFSGMFLCCILNVRADSYPVVQPGLQKAWTLGKYPDNPVLVYVPAGYDPAKPTGLYFFMHGGNDNTRNLSSYVCNVPGKKGNLYPMIEQIPFITVVPLAPLKLSDGCRWNRKESTQFILDVIEAVSHRYNIDRDRMILGGHSMGGIGAFHQGAVLADRFAGIQLSSGGWYIEDFKAFLGTPVYLMHGKYDTHPRFSAPSGIQPPPRPHEWTGVSFARGAHELMKRDDVEHVYDEYAGGHDLAWPAARDSQNRFAEWMKKQKRNPYPKRCAVITPCGSGYYWLDQVQQSRYLRVDRIKKEMIELDCIKLHGPMTANTEEAWRQQTYSLSTEKRRGFRLIAENKGGNRFCFHAENVMQFTCWLHPEMADLSQPIDVEVNGKKMRLTPEPATEHPDYKARIVISLDSSGVPVSTQNRKDDGFNQLTLQKLDRYMQQYTGTTGLIVMINGEIVHQYGNVQEISYIASCRKSVLAMLYGNAVASGKIPLDASLRKLKIDDVGGLLPSEKEATVWDLITARSGVYHKIGGGPEGKGFERGKTPHGTRFVYNNWDFNAAGTVFEKLTHQSIYKALEQQFAIPLGMQDFKLRNQKKGGNPKISRHRTYHMYLSTRDMALLGELMRRKGNWNGKQLIPAEWCKRITTVYSPVESDFYAGYGCMWWGLHDYLYGKEFVGAYSARGAHGQFITVLPALNMVVAHKSAGNNKKPTKERQYREILYFLLRAKECLRNTVITKYHFLKVPGKPVAYLADHPVEEADPNAEFAVIFIHGANGGATDPIRFLRHIVRKRGDSRRVYFILPAFLTKKSCPEELLPKVALWADNGKHDWRIGGIPENSPGVSSYEVADIICRYLSDRKRYPKLKHLLVTGFSAGGQFTNRYVAVGQLPLRRDIDSAFAVGAPSTYLYCDERRPNGEGHFAVPKMNPQIYNSWHCGLMDRNAYALRCSQEKIMKNISSRYTLYFCGEQDTSYKNLSTSPGSMQQGKNRIDRFYNYREYNKLFPEWHRSSAFFSCPNAGHSTIRVFSHPAFIDLIFGKRLSDASPPKQSNTAK